MVFSREAQIIWDGINEKATIENESLPIVEMYVNNAFPKNFFNYNLFDMKRYYLSSVKEDIYGNTLLRERRSEFSFKEIYCVAFNKDIAHTPEYTLGLCLITIALSGICLVIRELLHKT